jgi:hypothetical protein
MNIEFLRWSGSTCDPIATMICVDFGNMIMTASDACNKSLKSRVLLDQYKCAVIIYRRKVERHLRHMGAT